MFKIKLRTYGTEDFVQFNCYKHFVPTELRIKPETSNLKRITQNFCQISSEFLCQKALKYVLLALYIAQI